MKAKKKLYQMRKRYIGALIIGTMPLLATAQGGEEETGNYSRLDLRLVSQQPVYSESGISALSTHSLHGVGIGYIIGINVTGHRLPLYLEVGPELCYGQRSVEIDYWEHDGLTSKTTEEQSTKLLSLSSPIDLTYHCHLTDNLVFAPVAGLQAKVNLQAEVSSQSEKKHEDMTTDLFDEDAHRFQLGGNLGCGLYYKRLYGEIRYTADITPFQTESHVKLRHQSSSLAIGFRF